MRTTFILALATIVPGPFAIDQSRAADRLPAFDITQNCKTEGGSIGVGSLESCVKDEKDVREQLAPTRKNPASEWPLPEATRAMSSF
jgi:hypothetical protein